MRLTQDNRARPTLWLVCAACCSIVSFWYPHVFSYPPFSNQEHIPRELAAIRVVFFPIALLASAVGFYFYLSLWRKTWRHPDAVSRWLLAVGSGLFLVAFAPIWLFAVFCVAQGLLY
jgi:hypothetical protein